MDSPVINSVLTNALLVIAALSYLLGSVLGYRKLTRQDDTDSGARWVAAALALGTLVQGIYIAYVWFVPTYPDVSWINVLSASAWFVNLVVLLSLFTRQPLLEAVLVAMPFAAIAVILQLVGLREATPLTTISTATRIHMLSAVMAFSLLSIAAAYAALILILDRGLRTQELSPLLRSLPALTTLERLLFRLIAMGFLLLSVALLTGFIFVDDLFAQRLIHKTVLSIIAWVLFLALLLGRWRFGWRGRTAVILTLSGVAFLMLAYFGSKLVLEGILGDNWQV